MDPEKNREMQRAFNYYRNNLTGEPPAGSGDDLYNDREDYIRSDGQNLIEIGRDEAGNPIMSNQAAQQQTGTQVPGKSVLGGVADFVAPLAKPVAGNVLGYLYRFGNATDEERKTMTLPYMAKGAAQSLIHRLDNATQLEHTQLYENFFYNVEQKNAEIKRIANILQIDENLFAHDRELYTKAALAAERVERMGKFRKYQDAEGNIDMAKIYADVPGLAEAQKKYGTAAAALALADMDGLKTVNDVYDNAFSRFFGSIGTGLLRSMYTSFEGDIWSKARRERRAPDAEEQARIDALEAKLKDLPAYSYDSVGNVVGALLGSAAENAWMIGGSQKYALTAGAMAGLTMGPVAAERAYNVASTAVMADDIAALQYKENLGKLDKYGRPMYTPEQAALLSEAQGVGESILEQFSLKQMGRAIFGKSAAPALRDIIKKSATNEAAKAGVKEYALLKIKEAAKAGLISGSAEAFEEFSQSVSDMMLENVAQIMVKGEEAELNSMEDIFFESAVQSAAAIPAIAGFGIFGFLSHPVANTRAVLGFRSQVRKTVNNHVLQGMMANAHYSDVVNGVWNNIKNIKELQGKAPEVVETILDAQNRKAGLEYGFVDVKMLAQKEGGPELVRKIAEKSNISADELAACMNGSGMLQVKTSALMQMDLDDGTKKTVTDNLTVSLDAVTKAQHKEALKIASTQMKDLLAFEDKTYKQAVDNIIAARFPDAEEAQLAREIIEANYDNPQAEFKRRLDAAEAELMEIIDPVLRELKQGMKQGVDIIRVEGERDAHYEKVSNNAEWYRNFYEDYGRAPRKEELIGLAIDIASGRQNPRYGLQDYQNNTDERREYFAGVAERLDRLEEERNALKAIKDRMHELRPSEMAATATLSKEGLEVYDAAIRLMGTSENEKVQKAGRLNALLLARYADNMAKVFSRVKQKPYTAKDFVRERLKIDVNALEEKMQNAAQLMQPMQAENKVYVKNSEGNIDWKNVNNIIADNGEEIKAAPLRVQIGFQLGLGSKSLGGAGYTHIAGKHSYIVDKYSSVEGAINELLNNFDFVLKEYPSGREQLIIGKMVNETDSELLILELQHDDGDYYTVVGIKPQRKNQTEQKKEKALSFNGSATPLSASGDGALFTPSGIDAGTKGGSLARKDNVFSAISISEAGEYVKKYTYMPDQLNQMAGPKALTANQESLNRAISMFEEGKFAQEIFDKTGWVYGADDKWKFEIPDVLENINIGELQVPINADAATAAKLSDVYDNEKLYEAYPWLRETNVVVAYPGTSDIALIRHGANGRAIADANTIVINAETLKEDIKNKKPGESNTSLQIPYTLLHEIQHLIQEEEGFAKGGSPETVARQIDREIKKIEKQMRDNHPDSFAYWRRQKAVDSAFLLYATGEMTEEVLQKTQKELAEFEKFTSMTEEQKLKAWRMGNRLQTLNRQLYKAFENPWQAYEDLAGEQEANATAQRAVSLDVAKRLDGEEAYAKILQDSPKLKRPFNAIVIFGKKEVPLQMKKNQGKTFYQSAWHGTPNDFERFSTDYMGSGEGHQAHGWGLYFAKDRQVSEEYKRKLSEYTSGYRILSDGKIIMNMTRIINRYMGNLELEQAVAGKTKLLKKTLQDVIYDLSDENAFHPRTIRELKEQIERIDNNPKLSIAAFLEGTPADDWRYKSIVKSAKSLAKSEGRRVSIADVKAGLQKHMEGFELQRNRELEDLKSLQSINLETLKVERSKGTLFEVDVPEDDEMLDEDLPLNKQPAKVQKAIHKYLLSRPDYYIDDENLGLQTGKQFYKDVVFQMRREGETKPQESASKLLNSLGIKGITYEGARDGRCFVVFDDKAISILNKYYQQQSRLKGSIDFGPDGRRLISLFEGADQSTFVHEMAHMFLMDLQEIAGIDPDSREAKDLKTIMDWAQYVPGQSDEYKGTASETEFRDREEAIKAAVAAGDVIAERQLKEQWAQERFARGFEEYLRTGEAPARGLRNAFRQFKKWLLGIYRDVIGAGVRATPEVEAVMARMLASEEEIEALAAANNIARLKTLDPDILTDDLSAMRDRWQEEAKEKAKEKMIRQLMKQHEEQNLKDLDKKLEGVREAAELTLQNIPCFVCETLLAQGNSLETSLDICEFGSEQEYKDALYAAGGSLKQAVEREVSLARARMLETMPSHEDLYKMAEEALSSGIYNARISALEAEIIQAREKAYDKIPAKLQAAFAGLDGTLGDLKKESWEAVKKQIQGLKYAERWKAEEFAMIKELEDAAAKLDPDDQKAVERLLAAYQRIKEQVVRNKDWVRGVRDATKGQVEAIRLKAQEQMDAQPISVATNPRHWQRLAFKEGKNAWDSLGKSQSKGLKNGTVAYSNAVSAKLQQALFDMMTAMAIKNRKRLDQLLNGRDGMYARAKRMADPKYKADATMRYFHNHLLYIFGLRKNDAIAPVEEKTFIQLLTELREAHEFEEEIPAWIIAEADATKETRNYQQLTMGELEELDKVLKILYTLARNHNRLLTLDVDMDTVRAEIMADFYANTDYEVGNQRINEVKGAIGDYMNGLLKEEQILSILGGKQGGFIKYIYKVLFKATEAEETALEAEAKAQRELYNSFYTHEELRALVNDTLMVEGKDGKKEKLKIGDDTDITKEHLICMALNWGNRANRDRLLVGLFDCMNASDIELRGNELMAILQEHLTKKDWQFVQAMWNHIGEFADPVSEVMEKSMGVPLDRVDAEAFDVMLPSGEMLQMDGGYYPIVKDSGKSSKQTEFEQMEEAKAIGGASVFGAGISATKRRASNRYLNQGPLKLSLDVAHKHIKAQIHYTHMRMAVRDAYKVLNNENIKYAIEHSCGSKTVEYLNEWVLNCWAPPIRPHEWLEQTAAKIRAKTVSAIMAFRASTALLNAANVVYMAQEIGTGNALSAMAEFYKHPQENRQEILEVSVFMRNRATNMDRDLNAMQEKFLNRHEGKLGKVGNAVDKATGGKSEEIGYLMDKYANWMIEQTDMMVSLPLYRWQFRQTYTEEIAKGVTEEEARQTANYEATRRVTKVFGSSRAIDSSHVQRTKNEFVKLITPFFSFANTMMNAVWSKYYEGKLKGKNYGNEKIAVRDAKGNVVKDVDGNVLYTTEKEQFKKQFCHRYARFARAAFMNFFLGALVETWLRQLPDMLAGSGDDDDEDKFVKELGKSVLGNAAAGFPGINEGIDTLYSIFAGQRTYGGRGVGVLSGSAERYVRVITDLKKITEGSDKIDALDFFRDVARAYNTKSGMSDTVTDAVANTVRFAVDDGYVLSIDDPDDLREYIAKSLFDKKLKKRN